MKRILPFALMIAGIAGIWIAISFLVTEEEGIDLETSILESYSSDELGLSFEFPMLYEAQERDLSSGARERYSISLIEEGYVMPEAGEGPTSITVDVFQNDIDGYTAESFAQNVSDSNWKLGEGTLFPRTIGGEEGVEYTWSGLYEGKSIVIARGAYVYMFSVTHMAPEDRIIADFEALMETVAFFEKE